MRKFALVNCSDRFKQSFVQRIILCNDQCRIEILQDGAVYLGPNPDGCTEPFGKGLFSFPLLLAVKAPDALEEYVLADNIRDEDWFAPTLPQLLETFATEILNGDFSIVPQILEFQAREALRNPNLQR
ncbi:MAG: hypothetical protein ABL949_01590 [Fimbriimonadaceae bacterium]